MDPHDKAIIHGSAESNYRTPPTCFGLLNDEFRFQWDLAADEASSLVNVVQCGYALPQGRQFLGPGSTIGENALVVNWRTLPGNQFVNPPFSKLLVNAYNTGRIKINGEWPGQQFDDVKKKWVPILNHPIDRELAKAYDIANWAKKCWEESKLGSTIVGIFPFAPQTDWYRQYVYGHQQGEIVDGKYPITWNGHAAREERRLPHRISFLQPDGTPTGNAGVNSAIIVWKPSLGIVGPWQPHQFYWSYR